jgi:hypothetical protein
MTLPELLNSNISWDYDEEDDVLYLSVGKPRPAIGVVRYDETANEMVGLTVIGLKSRLLQEAIGQQRGEM